MEGSSALDYKKDMVDAVKTLVELCKRTPQQGALIIEQVQQKVVVIKSETIARWRHQLEHRAPVLSNRSNKVVHLQMWLIWSAVLVVIALIFKFLGKWVLGPLLLSWWLEGRTEALLLYAGLPMLHRYVFDATPMVTARRRLIEATLAAAVGLLTGHMISHRYIDYTTSAGLCFPLVIGLAAETFDTLLSGRPCVVMVVATVGCAALVQLLVDSILNQGIDSVLLLIVSIQALSQAIRFVKLLMELDEDVAGPDAYANSRNQTKIFQLYSWSIIHVIASFLIGHAYETSTEMQVYTQEKPT